MTASDMGLWRNWERICFARRGLRVRVSSVPPLVVVILTTI